MKIAFDFDDVLFHFTHKFQDYCVLNHKLTPVDKLQIKSPDFRDVFHEMKDVSQQIYDDLMSNKQDWNRFHELDDDEKEQMSHIHKHLLQLKSNNHELVIITARSELDNFHIVVNYCNTYFPNCFSDFYFCNTYSDKEIKRTKSEMCVRNNVIVLVDDSLHNIQDVRCSNIIGIPFGKYPWSQDETNINTWEELIPHLLTLF